MRAELQGILWLAAAGSLALAAVSAAPDAPPDDFVSDTLDRIPEPQLVSGAGAPHVPMVPDPEPAGRPLFRVAASQPEPPPPSGTATATTPPPVLKGVIERDGRMRAVFSAGDGTVFRYEVAGPGDVVGDSEIVSIDRNGVVATARDGTTMVFTLRGIGETP